MTGKSDERSKVEHWAYRTERAFKKAVRDEIAKHRAAGDPVYVMRNGRVVEAPQKEARSRKAAKVTSKPVPKKRGR